MHRAVRLFGRLWVKEMLPWMKLVGMPWVKQGLNLFFAYTFHLNTSLHSPIRRAPVCQPYLAVYVVSSLNLMAKTLISPT